MSLRFLPHPRVSRPTKDERFLGSPHLDRLASLVADGRVTSSYRAAPVPTSMRAELAGGNAREKTLIPVEASVGWYQS